MRSAMSLEAAVQDVQHLIFRMKYNQIYVKREMNGQLRVCFVVVVALDRPGGERERVSALARARANDRPDLGHRL